MSSTTQNDFLVTLAAGLRQDNKSEAYISAFIEEYTRGFCGTRKMFLQMIVTLVDSMEDSPEKEGAKLLYEHITQELKKVEWAPPIEVAYPSGLWK